MRAEGESGPGHRFAWRVGVILAVAAVIRAVLIHQMGSRYYFADTGEYEAAARSLLAGHGPGATTPRAPLYPALMALGFLLFGDGNLPAIRLIQLVVGLLVVALTMRLGFRIGGRHGALVAGVSAALAPTLVFTTSMLYPTALYTALLLAATLVARGLDLRPGLGRGALLGLVILLAWLTDPVAAAPAVALLLWLLWGALGPGRARGTRAIRVGAFAIAVCTAALLASPWLIYRQRTYGSPAPFMEKAQAILYFVRTDPAVAGVRAVRDTTRHFHALTATQFVGREWRLLHAQPVPYLSDYMGEFVHFFQPMPDRISTQNVYTSSAARLVAGLYFVPVLLLAAVGLLMGAARARERHLLALVPLSAAALYALFFTQMRYRIPTEPAMLVLAALGLERLFPRLAAALAGEPRPRAAPPEPSLP